MVDLSTWVTIGWMILDDGLPLSGMLGGLGLYNDGSNDRGLYVWF